MIRPLCRRHALIVAAALLAGCGGRNTAPTVEAPGRETSTKSQVLEAGAMIMQDRTPVDQVHMYVCGFHFYDGDMTRQVEAHHYCIQSNEDFNQCLIFSGNGKDAKLIGIEYIISARLFEGLPEDERRFWHSHHYEVKSGQLTAPGLPDAAEHALMEKFVTRADPGSRSTVRHLHRREEERSLRHPRAEAGGRRQCLGARQGRPVGVEVRLGDQGLSDRWRGGVPQAGWPLRRG